MSNPKGNEASLKKFKPKWYNGTTRTIRVPIALTEQILEYAHKLDESPLQVDEITKSDSFGLSSSGAEQTLTRVIEILEVILLLDRFTKRHRIKVRDEVVEPLKALLQVNKD